MATGIYLGRPPENIVNWIIADYNRKQEEKLKIPLCFEAVDSGATIALECNGNNLKTATFQTSTDGQNWSDYTYATKITLVNVGDKVYFRAKADNTSIARTSSNYLKFTTTQSSKKVKVSGNVMSLLAPEFSQMRSVSSYCFNKLFFNCKNISDCGSLTLPATALANNCYSSMFSRCSNLTQAPALLATTLADSCFSNMFSSCSSLTQAPALPATTLASRCYSSMFSRCSNLTQAPALPATTLADSCYYTMFQGCSSLTQAPALPATTLVSRCYYSMFESCTSLTQAPALPATTLADSCYYNMFYGCSSLTQAPALPATTLATHCYSNMFHKCTSLTQAPTIKTYTPELYAFESMLKTGNYDTNEWSLTVCNWPDLTLSEAESMVLNESIFGYNNPGASVRISITCKDGSGTAYYDSERQSWVFEH